MKLSEGHEVLWLFRKEEKLMQIKATKKKLLIYSRYRRFGFPPKVRNEVEKLWRFSPIKLKGRFKISKFISIQNLLLFSNPETNLSAVAADDKQASIADNGFFVFCFYEG